MVESGKEHDDSYSHHVYDMLEYVKKEHSDTNIVDHHQGTNIIIIPEATNRPRGRPKRKPSEHEWTYESTELLIEIYRSHASLYDVRHPDYHKRDLKEKAWDDIRDELVENGVFVDISDINSKLTSLKSYFCQERKKMASSRTNPSGEPYISRWKFFHSLEFLDDCMLTRNHYSTSDNEVESPVTNEASQKTCDIVIGQYGKGNTETSDVSMRLAKQPVVMDRLQLVESGQSSSAHVRSVEKSEDDIFGELIAKKMRKIQDGVEKETLKMKIQYDINNALFQPSFSQPSFPICLPSTLHNNTLSSTMHTNVHITK